MLEETGTKVSISTVKQVLYRHNLKSCAARKKPLLDSAIKKPDYGLQLHMGTKIILFGEMSSGLMKQKQNCLAIMIITLCLEEKGRGLQAKEHHPNPEARGGQHHVVGVLCCRRDWCTSQNRWHNEDGKVCGYIEATSVRKLVTSWSQMGLPNGK